MYKQLAWQLCIQEFANKETLGMLELQYLT